LDKARPVSINNSSAIIWKPSTGTKRRPRLICRRKLLRRRARNTSRPSNASLTINCHL